MTKGFIIEGFDRNGLITPSGAYDLVGEPCARVRSFPNAIRYADCITAVFEHRIEIVGWVEIPHQVPLATSS
jgi:hypothetical protein